MITNIYKYNLIGGNIMNKLKRFMALLSSTVILGTMGLFTVSATGKETHPYKVSNVCV